MVWPTLGSRAAKNKTYTALRTMYQIEAHTGATWRIRRIDLRDATCRYHYCSNVSHLTGEEDGLVAESFVVVDDLPVGSNLDLVCLGRIGRFNLERGGDDGFGRRRRGLGRLRVVRVPSPRRSGVVVVVETLDEVHRLRVGVGDDSRLCLRVSHHVPPADTTVVASTQIVKYQYQYASLKCQYKYQYLKTVL